MSSYKPHRERLSLFTARLADPEADRHERAWEAHLMDLSIPEPFPHRQSEWFGLYLDDEGALCYGQTSRDWPEGEIDRDRAEALAGWERWQAKRWYGLALGAWLDKRPSLRLCMKALRALKRMRLDEDNGNGSTWGDNLEMVVSILFEIGDRGVLTPE